MNVQVSRRELPKGIGVGLAGGTLRLYLHPERLPTLRLFTRAEAEIAALAERLQRPVSDRIGEGARVSVESCTSQIGSGALPVETLPSACLALRPPATLGRRGEGAGLKTLGARLRALPVPVIGRIAEGALRLDLRTLEDEAGFLATLDAFARIDP